MCLQDTGKLKYQNTLRRNIQVIHFTIQQLVLFLQSNYGNKKPVSATFLAEIEGVFRYCGNLTSIIAETVKRMVNI